MYNWFSKTVVLAGLLTLGLTACKKDEVRVTSEFGPAPVLTASSTNVGVLSKSNAQNTALTYSWTPYAITLSDNSKAVSPVTYTLQLAKAGTNFASVQELNASSGTATTLPIKTADLNKTLLALNLPFGQAARVDVRLKTTVAGNLAPLYSATSTLTATPYDECSAPGTDSWALVGPAGDGWPGSPSPVTDRVLPYNCKENAFVLRTALNAGDFKFRANKDWGTNLGALAKGLTPGATPVDQKLNGEDMTITTAGTYTIKLKVTLDAAGKSVGATVTITP